MAIHRHDKHESANAAMEWVDKRLPVTKVWNEHLAEYIAPKNFNFWYYFGLSLIHISEPTRPY